MKTLISTFLLGNLSAGLIQAYLRTFVMGSPDPKFSGHPEVAFQLQALTQVFLVGFSTMAFAGRFVLIKKFLGQELLLRKWPVAVLTGVLFNFTIPWLNQVTESIFTLRSNAPGIILTLYVILVPFSFASIFIKSPRKNK